MFYKLGSKIDIYIIFEYFSLQIIKFKKTSIFKKTKKTIFIFLKYE
jgi:hypothetical protein